VLFSELIAPLEPLLADAKVLYIVPDRFLYATPFSALFDGERGEYLIERRRIVIAPSGAFLLKGKRGPRPTQPALIVSDPANGSSGERLPAARREASAIARLYPRSILLEGSQATVERFVAAAPHSALIHYAGHAGADDTADGFLPLAASPGNAGSLDATSISRLALKRTRSVRMRDDAGQHVPRGRDAQYFTGISHRRGDRGARDAVGGRRRKCGPASPVFSPVPSAP
jgi:CHAT domain-containing protein